MCAFFGGLNGDGFGDEEWVLDGWGEDHHDFSSNADPLHYHLPILTWIKAPVVEATTDKAILVGGRFAESHPTLRNKETSFWVPKSLIRGWSFGQSLDKAYVWRGFKPKHLEQIDVTKEFEKL